MTHTHSFTADNEKLSIYVYIYICIYVWYMRIPYIYILPHMVVRDAIFPYCMLVHVNHAQEKRLAGQKG